jgi:hypothetical protein
VIKSDEIEAVRHFLTHCTLNDTPKVLGLCQQLLNEIELQQQIIDNHTNQFFKGEMNASNQANNQPSGVRGDSTSADKAEPEPVRVVPEVLAFTETRHTRSDSGNQSEAEDDLPEYRDYRIKEGRDQKRVDDSRLRAEVGREIRTQEGDATPSGESIDRALTRNQRRRNKRKQKRGNK